MADDPARTPPSQLPQSPGSQLVQSSERAEATDSQNSTAGPPEEGTPPPETDHVLAPPTETNRSDETPKVFVGGLSWETDDEALKAYFESYGTVIEANVKYHRDKERGTCEHRGFGFVQFASQATYDRVLNADLTHVINGKTVDVKPAFPSASVAGATEMSSSSSGAANVDPIQSKKVFVGGIGDLNEDNLREGLGKCGDVTQVEFIYDRQGGGRKGFCFVTFGDADSAKAATTKQFHDIGSVTVEVKPATSKEDSRARWIQKNFGAMGAGAGSGGLGGGGGMNNWSYYGYPSYGATPYYGGYSGYYGGGGYDFDYYGGYGNWYEQYGSQYGDMYQQQQQLHQQQAQRGGKSTTGGDGDSSKGDGGSGVRYKPYNVVKKTDFN
ncbi:heterogeneous nuclear ribonucleoprotein D-like [Oscarella lobularis]|uniref:heterogeneous nuclear ribonucleoprotein D-like n=1 Tax=Oscarella lobularis TaxID=121494 RepID=UPI003314325C